MRKTVCLQAVQLAYLLKNAKRVYGCVNIEFTFFESQTT